MNRTIYNRSVLRVKLSEWAKKNGGRCVWLGSYEALTKRWLGAVYSFETPHGPWEVTLPSDSNVKHIAIRTRFMVPVRAPKHATPTTGAWDFESREENALFRVFTDAAEKMLKGEVT